MRDDPSNVASAFAVINRQKACRHGQMLYNIHDLYVGRALDLYGEYCEGEIDLFRQLIQPGGVVIEAGANIGPHTLFLARQVAPSGWVFAFEPQRIVFQTLCANMALNSVQNVVCFQQALGAHRGTVKVPELDFTREGNFGGVELGSHGAGDEVPLAALDDYNLTRCDFVKVDVEGMEEAVLRGAAGTIQRAKPVIYVENDKLAKAWSLMGYIDSLGYRMYWHRPPCFNPDNFFHNPHDAFPGLRSLNMICLHEIDQRSFPDLERV